MNLYLLIFWQRHPDPFDWMLAESSSCRLITLREDISLPSLFYLPVNLTKYLIVHVVYLNAVPQCTAVCYGLITLIATCSWLDDDPLEGLLSNRSLLPTRRTCNCALEMCICTSAYVLIEHYHIL